MTNSPKKATDAPAEHVAPDPNTVVLRYTGKGMGAFVFNVPARDLTRADVDDLITRKVTTAHDLINSGCYEEA